MRPKFKKGDIAVYSSGTNEFESVLVGKVTYDLDEKQFEYHDVYDGATYYNYHLLTPNQGLTAIKQTRIAIEKQIAALTKEEKRLFFLANELEKAVKVQEENK